MPLNIVNLTHEWELHRYESCMSEAVVERVTCKHCEVEQAYNNLTGNCEALMLAHRMKNGLTPMVGTKPEPRG